MFRFLFVCAATFVSGLSECQSFNANRPLNVFAFIDGEYTSDSALNIRALAAISTLKGVFSELSLAAELSHQEIRFGQIYGSHFRSEGCLDKSSFSFGTDIKVAGIGFDRAYKLREAALKGDGSGTWSQFYIWLATFYFQMVGPDAERRIYMILTSNPPYTVKGTTLYLEADYKWAGDYCPFGVYTSQDQLRKLTQSSRVAWAVFVLQENHSTFVDEWKAFLSQITNDFAVDGFWTALSGMMCKLVTQLWDPAWIATTTTHP